jgi:hypothetical protein
VKFCAYHIEFRRRRKVGQRIVGRSGKWTIYTNIYIYEAMERLIGGRGALKLYGGLCKYIQSSTNTLFIDF